MRRLKDFTALTILLACFIGCEREALEINHGDNIVSRQEAQAFLKKHPTDFYKASVDSLFYRQLPNAKGDKITYAVLEATTSHYKEYPHESKLALFKDKKGVVRGFVVGIYPANSPELQAKKGYSGAIFYETIDGKLLKER